MSVEPTWDRTVLEHYERALWARTPVRLRAGSGEPLPFDVDRWLRPPDEADETMLARCSTKVAPWYIVPADKKWARNTVVAAIVRRTLEDMDPRFPKVDWDPAGNEVR